MIELDRSVSGVSRQDTMVAVLSHVPADRADAVEEAARKALR